jgi:sugar/nucleoside kinase (ribokinase family)
MKTKNSASRRGLLAGGNWIIDQVKLIDVFPKLEQLANIRSQSQGTGGAPYNVLLDLAKLGADFPLYGAGLVGKDALGQFILDDCRKHNIDSKYIRATADANTSYTDVMTEESNGRRTFFITAAPTPNGGARTWISRNRKQPFFILVICYCWMPWMNRTRNSERRPRACSQPHRLAA